MEVTVAPENCQRLSEKFRALSESNSMEEIDSFGALVRQSLGSVEKRTVEYNNLVYLQESVWDLLFKKLEIQHNN